jgi:GNAT superfamily N-acetyltransferase
MIWAELCRDNGLKQDRRIYMPGSMIHLLLARKINPKGSILFYIGNIAPDAVTNWEEKEITHFRNLKDRSQALTDLALHTPPSDDFAEGVLLHLYMDWRWDTLARDEFIKTVEGDWFTKYREEIGLTSSYAFHHTEWAKDLWEQMESVETSEYGHIPGATAEELRDFISRNIKWLNGSNTEASTAFTPEFIDGFIDKIADEYTQWKIQQEIAYYNSLPVIFDDFVDMPDLTDGEIELCCIAKKPAIPEKKWVPAYAFEIRRNGCRVGEVNLRIGYTDGLYYGGQIGYGVDEQHRGHGYASKACRLLAPVIRAHGMKKVLITNSITNIASKRTCEKLGAKLIRAACLPEWHDLYKEGQRFVNIFEWSVD